MWKLTGGYEVRDVHHGYFLVKFDKKEDKEKVISGAPWLIYDHYFAEVEDRRRRPFRFQAAWATHPSFEPLVRDTWEKPPPTLVGRLCNMKDASLKFNTE